MSFLFFFWGETFLVWSKFYTLKVNENPKRLCLKKSVFCLKIYLSEIFESSHRDLLTKYLFDEWAPFWKIVCVRGLDRASWKMNIHVQWKNRGSWKIDICSIRK